MTDLPPTWRISAARTLDLARPRVMAILNVTPDSFADGGALPTPEHAADAAKRAQDEGAHALDIGPASTRPGAEPVSDEEQIRRAIPAIERVRAADVDLPITIDATRARVAEAALDAGADAINDVSGGTDDPDLLSLAAERDVGVILMHRLTTPQHDAYSDAYRRAPHYGDAGVTAAVRAALDEALQRALDAGVAREGVVLDPGLGFGKTVEQNLELIGRAPELLTLGRPVLSALSRKSFVGRVGLGRDSDPSERLAATLALSVEHLRLGARIFRVHDVGEHRAALDAAWALRNAEQGPDDSGFPS